MVVRAPSRTTLGKLTVLHQTPCSWWGGGFLPLTKNPDPWSRAFGLDSAASPTVFIPQFLGVWIKHCTGVLITTLYSEKFPSTPTGMKTPHTYPIVVSGLNVSAECLPLYNPANRKIRLIFGQAEFRRETKFSAKLRLQPNGYR